MMSPVPGSGFRRPGPGRERLRRGGRRGMMCNCAVATVCRARIRRVALTGWSTPFARGTVRPRRRGFPCVPKPMPPGHMPDGRRPVPA